MFCLLENNLVIYSLFLFTHQRVALSARLDSSVELLKPEMIKLKIQKENQKHWCVSKKALHVRHPMLPAPKQLHMVPATKKALVCGL